MTDRIILFAGVNNPSDAHKRNAKSFLSSVSSRVGNKLEFRASGQVSVHRESGLAETEVQSPLSERLQEVP